MEILNSTSIDLTHVPYRGGPAGIGLLAGEVSAMPGGGSLVPTIQSGRVRGWRLGATRFPLMPELPTIGEIYPGYEVLIWHGLFAPAASATDHGSVARRAIEVLKQPDVIERLAASGSGNLFHHADEFGTHPRRQREIWQGDPPSARRWRYAARRRRSGPKRPRSTASCRA
jgi:tripartite-type tricarboxylate transporter receptor subunit TctC